MTSFLTSKQIWEEIEQRTKKSKRIYAAVAYIGIRGSSLLHLKKGDKLVCDMSLTAVKQGITNPFEIQNFIKRGVEVFSRDNLHAKMIVFNDATLIVGSANITNNSKNNLIEAGLITHDPVSIQRAKDYIARLCTEPVRNEYLKRCLTLYKPPKYKPSKEKLQGKERSQGEEIQYWFLGTVSEINIPDGECSSIEKAEEYASRKLKNPKSTEVDWIRYKNKPSYLDKIHEGDWIIYKFQWKDKSIDVFPPHQVLAIGNYIGQNGKPTYLLLFEAWQNEESYSWSRFKRIAHKKVPMFKNDILRVQRIKNRDESDFIQRLWTPKGRKARR